MGGTATAFVYAISFMPPMDDFGQTWKIMGNARRVKRLSEKVQKG
jgi:hypothetical protein